MCKQEVMARLSQGKMVMLVDAVDRENEADLVLPAQYASPESLRFMLRQAGGLLCVALSAVVADDLGLVPMVKHNRSLHQTPFMVSVEAATGVTSGISVTDRAHTIRQLVNPNATSEDFISPGHVFPLRAHPDGVLGRLGHTEGSVDLMRLAGLAQGAVLCEMLDEMGEILRGSALVAFSESLGIPMVGVADVRRWVLEGPPKI